MPAGGQGSAGLHRDHPGHRHRGDARLVFAPCEEVATTPPGTYRDVFRSELEFTGTVDGEPASAKVLYQGGVEPGGEIDAHLIFSRGVAGVLDADARVAVGGDYRGTVVVK